MGVLDAPDLRERHGEAVARHDGEVADAAEIEALRAARAGDHLDPLGAVADRRDGHAGEERLQRLRHGLRIEPERAGALLVDDEAHRRASSRSSRDADRPRSRWRA